MPTPVGIIGGSGYTGTELLRILLDHPHVEVAWIASRTHAGRPVAEVHPAFLGRSTLVYETPDFAAMTARCQVVFAAVPHGAAMEPAAHCAAAGVKFIDLGTDFRFRDPQVYRQWYGLEHTHPEMLPGAAYGLTELCREEVRAAQIVGNPGCYPTSTLLGIAPLAAAGCVDLEHVVISAVSGVSGAGGTPTPRSHFPDCVENVQAYGVAGHRHAPEIEQGIARVVGGPVPAVSFTPHLVPMSRGIHATLVLSPTRSLTTGDVLHLMQEFYQHEPFVQILGDQSLPQTKALMGSNYCHISARMDERAGKVVVLSAIDNLGKGAAGQAIQNMNLMLGWDEGIGLRGTGMVP